MATNNNNPPYTPPIPNAIGVGISLAAVGAGGAGSSGVITANNNTWTSGSFTPSAKLEIKGPDADILINNHSLSDWMQQVEKRLSILSPKPELLEKYENLQQAYEHYKTLEALLYEDKK